MTWFWLEVSCQGCSHIIWRPMHPLASSLGRKLVLAVGRRLQFSLCGSSQKASCVLTCMVTRFSHVVIRKRKASRAISSDLFRSHILSFLPLSFVRNGVAKSGLRKGKRSPSALFFFYVERVSHFKQSQWTGASTHCRGEEKTPAK